MKNHVMIALLLALSPLRAEVLDRIAVVVGKSVITEGEVVREIRLAAFLDGETPDLSAAAKRRAAERLVDQELIRSEIQASHYPEPSAEESQKMLLEIRKRFPAAAQYRNNLENYDLTEEDLESHLRWQLAALRFTEIRFRPALLAETRPSAEEPNSTQEEQSLAAGSAIDQLLDAWLKDVRSRTEIEFRDEVFR